MSRALVLNAGAAWCAYQVGALRQLVGERGWHFDVCAATGIAAMNAAFVACGRMAELEEFWSSVRPLELLPSRRRRFLAAHVGEAPLAERGTTLLLTALNLRNGRQEVLRYPGGDLPLVDGILAAGALPGLVPPLRRGDDLLVEGTILDGVPMAPVIESNPTEIVAVLAALPLDGGPPRRYETWFSVLKRAIAANQGQDVRRGLADAAAAAAEAEARRRAAAWLSGALGQWGTGEADEPLPRLPGRLGGGRPGEGPSLVAVRPSQELPYPMWRFRRSELAAAMALGERDARAAR